MDSLCSNLVKTYNTNYLDTARPIIRKIFYKESEKHKDGVEGRTTLMKCISNHFTPKKPIASYIGGPISLSYHRKDGKHIYIFGEIHMKYISCHLEAKFVKIDDYLYELLQTTDVFLDIYFELSPPEARYTSVYDDDSKSGLTSLFFKFKKCIDYTTRSDDTCRLGRIHYNDFRYIISKTSRITKFYQYLIYLKFDKLFLPSSKKILSILAMDEGEDKYIKLFLGMITENYYMKKELGKSFLEDKIKSFIMTKIIKRAKTQKDVIVHICYDILAIYKSTGPSGKLDDMLSKKLIPLFRDLSKNLVIIIGREMDAYLLARVFKKFDIAVPYAKYIPGQEEEEEIQYCHGTNTDQPIEPHNIVIYAGNNHSQVCREFLSTIGFEEVKKVVEPVKDGTCIDMRDFPQPFFNTP